MAGIVPSLLSVWKQTILSNYTKTLLFLLLLTIYVYSCCSHLALFPLKKSSALCNGGTQEGKNIWFSMFLQLPPQPWRSRTDVTMGDDWMDQSVHWCKDILPGDQMKEVSSLFTLIAPQGTMHSPTAVSWRMCFCAHLKECEEDYSSLPLPIRRNLLTLLKLCLVWPDRLFFFSQIQNRGVYFFYWTESERPVA